MKPPRSSLVPIGSASRVLAAAAALGATAAAQQTTLNFSVDWKSPTVSRPDSVQTIPITEADILRAGSPTPGIAVTGNGLSLAQYASCVGHQPGTPCEIELDSLSDGNDAPFGNSTGGMPALSGVAGPKKRVWFSVDEYAQGSVLQSPPHPQVSSEGAPPAPFSYEASADVFCEINLPVAPLPPTGVAGNNVGVFDGNGAPSANQFFYPALGLVEPVPPTPPSPPMNPGDNLDALDLAFPYAAGTPLYVSLDSAFVDPRTGIANNGSAAGNGFVGGDVLRVGVATTPLALYASATSLGLDRVPPPAGGPDSDDLDALILWENGTPGFQPSQVPFDWSTGARDMLIFSVRRGSKVIGMPDSIFGVPIEEGDLLTTPKPIALGGVSVFPGLFIAAEHLGLATARTNMLTFGDDVDALDYAEAPCFDCNKNGVEDAVDIATGASADTDKNGIPDECEDKVVEFCWCPAGAAPCGNYDAAAGCANSTGVGALNAWTAGSVNVAADDLVLTVTHLPLNVSGLMYMGATSKRPTPFYDGLRCVNSPTYRYAIANSGSSGALVLGPGIVATSILRFGPSGEIDAGETWYFQCWYRDNGGPCADGSNLSNVVRVIFQP